MQSQKDALTRLNTEKDYENKLASDLTAYLLYSLDSIPDMTDEEREKTRNTLKAIASESEGHSHIFSILIQHVLENGENNY
jgi:hypothetical protein